MDMPHHTVSVRSRRVHELGHARILHDAEGPNAALCVGFATVALVCPHAETRHCQRPA